MRNLLIQLDSAPHPSVFDRIVALDAGADEVISYGGVTENDVRDLVHGAIFTRESKQLRHTAIFVGGPDVEAGERILAAVQASFFGRLRVSVMLDSNGCNTTAAAAVAKLRRHGNLEGSRAVVVAGTGAVGTRVAGLLAQADVEVTITSRQRERRSMAGIVERFGGTVCQVDMADADGAASVLERAEWLVSAGPPGVRLVPRRAWAERPGLRAAADLNAVPPFGIEGIEPSDDGVVRDGVTVFGALGIGGLKMKVHRICIGRLFERNDLVLDAETIAEIGRESAS